MKPSLLIAASLMLAALLPGCKKEKTTLTPDPPTAADYFMPTKTGNYWVYKREQISLPGGPVTSTNYDTLRITEDSVMNGLTFYKFTGGIFLGINDWLADSSGWMVEPNGSLFALSTTANHTLGGDSNQHFVYSYRPGNSNVPITVAAGSFTCTEMVLDFLYADGGPPPPLTENPRHGYTWFAKGIGVVKGTTFYASSPGEIRMELQSYYIQE